MADEWCPERYDSKLGFVSAHGQNVIGLLQPMAGESVLDVGCGTGDITARIRESGAHVVGIDKSEAMIAQARSKYPELRFMVADAECPLPDTLAEAFDAVFSNAALHWMKAADQVLAEVWRCLRPGGRFVAEFGGRGNIRTVEQAIEDVLQAEYGIEASAFHPWYFPPLGEYASRLEAAGFHVDMAVHFNRPTALPDGDAGMDYWLESFAKPFVRAVGEKESGRLFRLVKERCRPSLYSGDEWTLDYARLRFAAHKPLRG
ncbi:class I SAM-dependent methyltransferase [Paenibacillus dendritiformis]|uniref:class I SAM-dependent methyltransferase n=1 Tax=Paenibacillus dendritiformis TaxID=130049 RepID=UPI000DA97E44|nr:class I SAM-dependent methyltransferase [Paenibacillus dendritiformis]PZM65941.1 SAM-dependent methyltransferase [Paenibacillus dendritiformis]